MQFLYSTLYTFFSFVIVLSILVFVHEYGHYLGCLICKVRVDSFSIGMGKEIWGWTNKKNVRWKISLLPLGGYVKMYGDADASSGKADKNILAKLTEEEKKSIIYFQPSYKKFLITVMGPLFNMIFAIILFTMVHKNNGISVLKPIVNDVMRDSPAYKVLLKGDVITEINGKKIEFFNQVKSIVGLSNGEPLQIKFLRNNTSMVKEIKPVSISTKDIFNNDANSFYIGIVSQEDKIIELNVFQSFVEANKTTWKMCKNTLIVLGQMLTGKRNADGLGGPLKIAKYSAQSFDGGFILVIYFMAMISANLGLMNLLPIPVLDGGGLLFLVIEMLFRKEIPEKIQEKLLNVGFSILIILGIFVTFNDIKSFF